MSWSETYGSLGRIQQPNRAERGANLLGSRLWLTKAGLYHRVRSKQHLLVEIMHYGMDLLEDRMLLPIVDHFAEAFASTDTHASRSADTNSSADVKIRTKAFFFP